MSTYPPPAAATNKFYPPAAGLTPAPPRAQDVGRGCARTRAGRRTAAVRLRDADGEPVPGRMDLPEGWYALPLDRQE